MILTPLQKLPNNVGDLGKIIVATSFEWLPKVKKIAQSGHTAQYKPFFHNIGRPANRNGSPRQELYGQLAQLWRIG